ncbi:hypothetical protein ACFRR7_28585 [Streptomyces sp. NPDC056909]|uniref:hypothetical protein n=1 Tax=Streptomyces sp. NPDC056909 TaxID=3345963 RepID=UPI0036B81AA4
MSDSLPGPVVARLLDDEESDVRTTMALHARDQVDPATAERINRGYRPGKKTRRRPADDFPLPADVLRRLATDPDHRVRRTIASHPQLPPHELTQLLADPSESVATTAAANPNLPPEQMHQLLALARL